MNDAEFFVPFFYSGFYGPNDVYSHEGHNKSCGHMDGFFKDCIPMKSELYWDVGVSIYAIGGVFGSLAFSPLCVHFFGNVVGMSVMSVLFLCGYFLKSFFSNVWVLIAGRLVCGMGAGMSSVVVPIYLTEISPRELRGCFGSLTQFGIVCGIFLASFVSLFTYEGQMWRLLFALPCVFALVQLCALPLFPCSPKNLLRKKMHRFAYFNLQRLRCRRDVELEFTWMQKEFERETRGTGKRQPWKRVVLHVFIASVLQIIQQLSGINAIIFYSTKVFAQVFPTGPTARVLSVLTMFVNLIAVLPSFYLVEKIGRKSLMLIGIGVAFISMLLITVSQFIAHYGFADQSPGTIVMGVFTILGVLVYMAAFEISLGPVPTFVVAEMLDTRTRAFGTGVTTMFNWLFTFFVGIFYPIANTHMKVLSFLPFTLFLLLSFLFVLLCQPETKGKRIEHVRLDWAEDILERIDCFQKKRRKGKIKARRTNKM